MKCPKCGYNSFECYDNCVKCSNDLTGYKQTYFITPILLPLAIREKMATEFLPAESPAENVSTATTDDMFSFKLPEVTPPEPDHHNDDPFNFDEPLSEANTSKPEEDIFANLLESTSQVAEAFPAAAKPAPVDFSAKPGELDLESFSWDDAPTAVAVNATEPADDFDSIFGDPKVNFKK